MSCHWCGSSILRTSRLYFVDLPRLVFFQYPVRCRECDERFFTNLFEAMRIRAAAKERRTARLHQRFVKLDDTAFRPHGVRLPTSLQAP